MNLPKQNSKEEVASDNSRPEPVNHRRCAYCGQIASIVWVHGHGQCSACGINVDECCRGENCNQ